MRIPSTALNSHLEKGLAPFYFLFGPEILLVEEALDLIRQQALQQSYGIRESHTADRGFDWDILFSASRTMSIFVEKKILEIRIPTGSPGVKGGPALQEYLQMPSSSDTLILLISGAVDRRTQGTKWFQALESSTVAVECPQVIRSRLPEWIEVRIQSQGFTADREAVQRLAHYVEGNLLAAAQQISLLGLLAPGGRITADLVTSVIADSARFNNFNFADACLTGSVSRATRILSSLRTEQAEPILILAALTREVRTLCRLSAIRDQGGNPNKYFMKLGIWRNREPLYRSALKRLPAHRYRLILRRLAHLDLQIKGRIPLEKRNVWEEIESIGLDLCGITVP